MKLRTLCLVFLTVLGLTWAGGHDVAEENPAAEGFDDAGSDPAAVEIADHVMRTLGGRDAWDSTRFITWKFFGRRGHIWDKHTGDIRVEGVDRDSETPYLVLMNLHTMEGQAWWDGEEVTDTDRLTELLDRGEAAWINDSYWLVMPYKLKDSGVTLRKLPAATLLDGRPAEVLELTFENVGRTPENKYHVYVAQDTGLVEQWDFYAEADDPEPRFQIPWLDWQPHGQIYLSANRGEPQHTHVAVLDELPGDYLSSPAPVDWDALAGSAQP